MCGAGEPVSGKSVVVLDYGSGNLRSAHRALERVGAEVTVTDDPGAAAAGIGIPVPDPAGDYLVVFRQLILWPVDADGLIQGEDAYHSGPVSVTALSHADLPDKYLAMTEGRPRTHA